MIVSVLGDVDISLDFLEQDEDILVTLKKLYVWVGQKHKDAQTMKKNLRNDLDTKSLDTKALLLQVKVGKGKSEFMQF